MLITHKKISDIIAKHLHFLLKPYNKKLTMNVVKDILSRVSGKNDEQASSTHVFMDKIQKEVLKRVLSDSDIIIPNDTIIDKAFSNSIPEVYSFKEPSRTQISNAIFAEKPYMIFDSADNIYNDEHVVNNDFSKYSFCGFSLYSFAYKNKLTLDDACAKIQHLLNNDVIYCIGCDESEDPIYHLNHIYQYIAKKNDLNKPIANIRLDTFMKHLHESIEKKLCDRGLNINISKLNIIGHIESEGKLSGAMVVSVSTDQDISFLSEDIGFINETLLLLSTKVKLADRNIGYIHFSNTGLMPRDFLSTHLSYETDTQTIVKEKSSIANIDSDWDDRQCKFLAKHNYMEGILDFMKHKGLRYLIASHTQYLAERNDEPQQNPIELSLFFSNIGSIPHDKTPAYLVSTLLENKWRWNDVTLNYKITSLQALYMKKLRITEDDINIIGKLNWCVSEVNNNKKKQVAKNKTKKAPYYLYYDLKHRPARLVAIGTTTANPMDFFARSEKIVRQVKRTYSEISIQPCPEETANLADELFKSRKYYMKMINIIDNVACLFPSRYRFMGEQYSFDPTTLKAKLTMNIEPRALIGELDIQERERYDSYTDSEVAALQYHIRSTSKYTIQDMIDKIGDTTLLNGKFSRSLFSKSENEWSYHYQEKERWVKMTVNQQDVHVQIQGEKFYDLRLVTELKDKDLHLLTLWLPVIITLVDTMNFDYDASNELTKENNKMGLDEINVDIFYSLLEQNTYHYSGSIFTGALGRMMSYPHLEYTEKVD